MLVVDSARYTDPDWFCEEQERIFSRSWVPAAGAWSLNRPGDYAVFEELGQSILLLRGPDLEWRPGRSDIPGSCLHSSRCTARITWFQIVRTHARSRILVPVVVLKHVRI